MPPTLLSWLISALVEFSPAAGLHFPQMTAAQLAYDSIGLKALQAGWVQELDPELEHAREAGASSLVDRARAVRAGLSDVSGAELAAGDD